MERRRQSGEHHLVSSMAGIGLAFRQTEIRLWALIRRGWKFANDFSQSFPAFGLFCHRLR